MINIAPHYYLKDYYELYDLYEFFINISIMKLPIK